MNELFEEYDNILIGNQNDFSLDNFNGVTPGGHNEYQALSCIRYAIEHICAWDEDTAILKFDDYAIESLKLKTLLRFIKFPPELEDDCPKYILHRLYPARVKINFQALAIQTIKDVLSEKRSQYPRDFFVGEEGFRRYCYCIKYLIENYIMFDSIEKIYLFFSSPKGNLLLNEKKLRLATYLYKIDIFDVIYAITKEMPDGELYYNYYCFKREYLKNLEKTDEKKYPISTTLPVITV